MLNYKVRGRNDISDIRQCFFENRGITDVNKYINLDDSVLIPYEKLDNINEAVDLLLKHIENKSHIAIVVDCDVDGYTSAAMMYQYIKKVLSPDINITYLLHTGKMHGLSPDITIPDDTQLVILPDGGTNDTERCRELKEKGIDILILDHHISDIENPYAVIVNNQMSENYSNKELCGAGIVYKFLQAVDEETWTEYTDHFLDLVALANIADLMDIRSYETKRLIDKGLKRINNKGLKAFTDKLTHINGHLIAFKVVPFINAMCRCGKQEEKDLVFRAFIETDESFQYKKRNSGEITESVYDRAVRLCTNAKSRQDREVKKNLPEFKEYIESKNRDKDPVIFHRADSDVSGSFTGLYAMKLADHYSRPCLVLRKDGDIYRGSARSYDNCPIESLKQFLTDTDLFEFCQGHENAFGLAIRSDNIPKAIAVCKNELKDVDFSEITVDFEIDYSHLDVSMIQEIDRLQEYYGTGLKEPTVAIKDIALYKNQGVVIGKDLTTWKFITDDNISFIRFKNDSNDYILKFLNSYPGGICMFHAICKLGFNDYGGIITPQVQVLDYEVI